MPHLCAAKRALFISIYAITSNYGTLEQIQYFDFSIKILDKKIYNGAHWRRLCFLSNILFEESKGAAITTKQAGYTYLISYMTPNASMRIPFVNGAIMLAAVLCLAQDVKLPPADAFKDGFNLKQK